MAQNILLYTNELNESTQLLGFKIINSKDVKKYFKIINLLEEESVEISNGEFGINYNSEDFDTLKITRK